MARLSNPPFHLLHNPAKLRRDISAKERGSSDMPKDAGSNACTTCARSKRKCGREMPSCARCVNRGRSCVYPMSNGTTTSSRMLLSSALKESGLAVENELLADFGGDTASTAIQSSADDLVFESLLNNEFDSPSSLIRRPSTLVSTTDSSWFLAPETWKISHRMALSADVPAGRKTTMRKYISLIQSWFERWVNTGSNPFIHHRLYSSKFPACVQIAYTTLASYIHRTPANTETVLQIVEDRSNSLLQENGATLDLVGAEKWADEEPDQGNDLFAQLARLHALMVYQVIGLFDGDTRSRFVAEGHMAVQDSWSRKLYQSAGDVFSNSASATQVARFLPRASNYSQEQWYLWILAESIRRTWLVAASLAPIFTALQQGWSVCPGGVMYTNRSGMWNAESATGWEKQRLEGDAAFLHRFGCGTLFDNAKPADVDEFGTAMLGMTLSEEVLESWRERSGGS